MEFLSRALPPLVPRVPPSQAADVALHCAEAARGCGIDLEDEVRKSLDILGRAVFCFFLMFCFNNYVSGQYIFFFISTYVQA